MSARWPTASPTQYPCGHPRTPENSQSIGVAGVRCKACRRRIARESGRRMYHAKRRASIFETMQPNGVG